MEIFNIKRKKKIKKFYDVDCSICFNTTYSDNNAIVYCSVCKLGMHKYCYGIKTIPKGRFLCDSCIYYE